MANPNYIYDPYRTVQTGTAQSPQTSSEDAFGDYLEFLIPASVRRIQQAVRRERELLDHPGSILYDEYPDREAILYLVDRVYDRILDPAPAPSSPSPDLFLPIEDPNRKPVFYQIRQPDSTERDSEGRALFLNSPLYDLVKWIVAEELRALLLPGV